MSDKIFKRIRSDIKDANNILKSDDSDEYDIDLASYHVQQAIEKCLKYILHNIYGVDNTTRQFKIHNIGTILDKIEEFEQGFKTTHQDIADLASDITNWEASTRYEDDPVSIKEDVEKVLSLAEKLLIEIQERILSQNKESSENESSNLDVPNELDANPPQEVDDADSDDWTGLGK